MGDGRYVHSSIHIWMITWYLYGVLEYSTTCNVHSTSPTVLVLPVVLSMSSPTNRNSNVAFSIRVVTSRDSEIPRPYGNLYVCQRTIQVGCVVSHDSRTVTRTTDPIRFHRTRDIPLTMLATGT